MTLRRLEGFGTLPYTLTEVSEFVIEVAFIAEVTRAASDIPDLIAAVDQRLKERAWIGEILKHEVSPAEQKEINEIYQTREPAASERIRNFILALTGALDRAPIEPAQIELIVNKIKDVEILGYARCRPELFPWRQASGDLQTIAFWLFEVVRLIGRPEQGPDLPKALKTAKTDLPRKRGRPPIPEDLKRKALKAKQSGAPGREVATMIYPHIKNPTRQQIKNALSVLRHFKKRLQVRVSASQVIPQ
jgi:hypothetical protein